MLKLTDDAINELMSIIKEVNEIIKFYEIFGIYVNTSWYSTDNHDKECDLTVDDLINMKFSDFKKLNVANINEFHIGGSVSSAMYKFKGEYVCEPKVLAILKGEIFENALKEIINTNSFKYFDVSFIDEYGIYNDDGWEHPLFVKCEILNVGLLNRNDFYLNEILESLDDLGEFRTMCNIIKQCCEYDDKIKEHIVNDYSWVICND